MAWLLPLPFRRGEGWGEGSVLAPGVQRQKNSLGPPLPSPLLPRGRRGRNRRASRGNFLNSTAVHPALREREGEGESGARLHRHILVPHLIEISFLDHNLAMETPHWTADEDRLLGTMSDRDAGKRLGRPPGTIYKRRRKLRLAPFCPFGRLWHRAEDELLGTMPDRTLARRLKRSVLSVAARRRDRHIPIFHSKKHRWTPTDDKLLSERPDAQVAMLLGISRLAVKHRRIRLGISRPGREHFRLDPWQPREDALLGTASDRELAGRLGRSISSVRLRRIHLGRETPCRHWTPEADALLGKMPDQAVARSLGRTVPAVSTRRKRLGIPAAGRGSDQ